MLTANNDLSDTLVEFLKAVEREDILELEITTSKGTVDLLAEIIIDSNTLHVRDIAIYGRDEVPLTGLSKTFLVLRTQFVKAARKMGFRKLRITGERAKRSTSASPGKEIDITVDLI
ncbi:hypothetical protein QUF80_02925 [Desulfococcaceae bacterium HSG8]|nr:hypothetical protein [Desulfococcaceae bacterium HSG8]